MIRTKTCPTCGANFSYEIGKGKDKKHCSDACRVRLQLKLRAERYESLPCCSVAGCEGRATRRIAGLCEKHYIRMRRTGGYDAPPVSGRYRTGAGYIKILMREHPLSDSRGHVAEHRAVAYDVNNGICPGCFWCGCSLNWVDAVVDHLNEIKDDNRSDNLVVACNDCNRARGAMMHLVGRITHEAIGKFIECILSCHSAKTQEEMRSS